MLARFHGDLIEGLSSASTCKISTVNEGMIALKDVLPKKLKAKIRRLDMTYKVARHLSNALLDETLAELHGAVAHVSSASDDSLVYEKVDDDGDDCPCPASTTTAPTPIISPMPATRDLIHDHVVSFFSLYEDDSSATDVPEVADIDVKQVSNAGTQTISLFAAPANAADLRGPCGGGLASLELDAQYFDVAKEMSCDALAVESVVSALYDLARAADIVDDAFPNIGADLAKDVYNGFCVDLDAFHLHDDAPVCAHLDALSCLAQLKAESGATLRKLEECSRGSCASLASAASTLAP